MTQAVRDDVVLAGRVLAAGGHEDAVWGHVSVRDATGRGIWMKGSGLGLAEVTSADVVLVDWQGNVPAGSRRRHAEYPIHTELMGAREDVNCVIHTHPRHAVAFGLTALSLSPSSQAAGLFTDGVPRFTQTARLIDSPELGRAVAATIADSRAALLVNHGIVVVGASTAEATVAAIALERACEEQLLAAAAGGVAHVLTAEQAARDYAHIPQEPYIRATWEFLVRRLRDAGSVGLGGPSAS
ncbi:MAG TPA: class II aldolase/adducin family protein [Solirubrobacteraceae bacterium]|jgi:L-fuculose-phosphate aldolase|nr:class II aldolase/adducin family protein [Solirubrobacteraceae bacterium]